MEKMWKKWFVRKPAGTSSNVSDEAKEVAIRHYELLQKGDYEGWVSTLCLWLQEVAGRSGSSPYFWWKTGRHYVEDYGVYYEYYKEGKSSFPNTRKFFFKRKNPDGSDRGMPVPITVKLDEDGVWRVDQASY
ncbi:MAG: hypothetical protein ACTSWP_11325 [Candidatus Freyarchaeota archaeon]